MKLLLKQSFKSIPKHLIQFLCVFFMILLSVIVFVSSNSNTESLRNGFDKMRNSVNYRDANTISTAPSATGSGMSFNGGAYNYALDTYYDKVNDPQNRNFRLYNSPFNQLIWGVNLDSATNLPDGNSALYAYLVSLDPSFTNFKKDFIPTFINSISQGQKVFVSTQKDPADPHDPFDSFWRVLGKFQETALSQIRIYLKKIYDDISLVSRKAQRYVSLTDFLIRYFYNDPFFLNYDRPSFINFANDKNTQSFTKGLVNGTNIDALSNQSIDQGIGSRQLFSFSFQNKGVANNFVFVNNSQYIDKTYTNVKFSDFAKAKDNNEVLLSKNYINGNNYKDGSKIPLNKNGAVLGDVYVGGTGYIMETLAPLPTGLFGLSFFNPNISSTAIVNNETYYQLHQRLTITNDTAFSTIKYNNRVNKNFQLGALNDFLYRYIGKPYISKGKPFPPLKLVNSNTAGPVQSSSYGANSFNFSYTNFPSMISNSDTFIFTFLAILLSITGVVLIFIVKRQCDSMRKTLGILKASGYSSFQLSSVFLGFTFTASVFGSLIGTGVGWLVGLWITSQSLVNYLGPFPSFVYSNLSLFAPLGIVTVTLLVFSFFTSAWILRSNADKLMRPGSDISTNKIIIFFQYFVRKTSFKTRFRLATILLAPFKTGIIFLSFLFSSFLLIFSIFGFSLFQNVVNSTLNGLNYKYSYKFKTSNSLLDRYLMLDKEGVNKYLPKQNALINAAYDGHNTSSVVSRTQALKYENKTITYNGNRFQLNNSIVALFADTGSFYDSDGNFTSVDKWGLSGMYLDKNTFNSIFENVAKPLTFKEKLAAWVSFWPQLTRSLYGSATPLASATPTLNAINTLKRNFGGSTSQNEFLNRSLTFNKLASTTYLQFQNDDLYKLAPLLSQGIAITNPAQTVDLNFVRYDDKTDLPYFTERVKGFANDGKEAPLNLYGIDQSTNKLNQFYKIVNQNTFESKASFQNRVLGVVVNQLVASRLHAHVGSIVNTDFKINITNPSRGSPTVDPFNLKLKILQIIPGYFGSQVFTQYNSFATIYASHIAVTDKKDITASTIIKNGIGTSHAVYNGMFSKNSDNLATLNTPVYTRSPQDNLFAYYINITLILSLSDIQKFIKEAQALFVLALSLILALTCVISLIIIIATTNIILNDFKNNIVIMKLFGYNDLKVSWLIMSVFLFIIIIAFLLAVLAVILVYRWLTQFLEDAINLQVQVIYTFQGFLLCISIIVFLYIVSFLLNWSAIKRISLVESLNKD